MDSEIWRDVVGYEGLYQVSNLGRVKSFWYGRERILKPRFAKGYPRVQFKRGYAPLVHRLVAEAFIPNPNGKPAINHINGCKTDNRVENLEWATGNENMYHAVATGLMPQGEDCYNAKLTNAQVRYVRENPDNLTQCELTEMFGVNNAVISAIQLGLKYRNAGGTIRKSKLLRLSKENRNQIRAEYKPGSRKFGRCALSRMFGVHYKTVLKIVHEAD